MDISKKEFPKVKNGVSVLNNFMCALAADPRLDRDLQETDRLPQESGGHGRFKKR